MQPNLHSNPGPSEITSTRWQQMISSSFIIHIIAETDSAKQSAAVNGWMNGWMKTAAPVYFLFIYNQYKFQQTFLRTLELIMVQNHTK